MVTAVRTLRAPGRAVRLGETSLTLIDGGLAGADHDTALVCRVVHHVAGRVRLRLPLLTSRPELAERVRAGLVGRPGIRAVRVTVACASVTVTFDPQQATVAAIQSWISRLAAPLAAAQVRPAAQDAAEGLVSLGLGSMVVGLLAELRRSVEPSDVLDLVCSGLRGELRVAALALGLTILGRSLWRAIAARVESDRWLDASAPERLPVPQTAALAA